jgi:FkbM family methyltransferase
MKRYIENFDYRIAEQLLEDIFKRQTATPLKKLDRPIVLYGAGDLGQMAKDFFTNVGVKVEFIIDANADKCRKVKKWKGSKILFPNEVDSFAKNRYKVVVCIVTSPYSLILDSLLLDGWQDISPFYDVAQIFSSDHPLNNGWYADHKDIKNSKSVLGFWSDNISSAYYLQFIAWRVLREEWLFEGINVDNNNRFFIKELIKVLSDEEYFVDIGAHFGNTTKKFIKTVNNKFKKVLMIEPDLLNANRITANRYFKKPDITLLNVAIGYSDAYSGFFDGYGYMSKLSKYGKFKVQVKTLDSLDIKPTFIKMHLEGGEMAALEGGKNTIINNRPILVVTTYHNSDGVYKLPCWFKDNLENYSIIMRNHSWNGTGCVIYGVPNERYS